MASKRPRTKEIKHEQVEQQCAPITKVAESSSVKFDNYDRNSPVVVFAHGAGAPSTSDWMIRWRNLLATALNPVEVVAFDYPYISGRRKAAPEAEKLVAFHLETVRKVAAKYPEHPLILVGKSLGSRVSCMVAAENDIRAVAVVCLGYPLKATNGFIRDEPLLKLTVPIMFVQGSNDSFCPLDRLEVVRKQLKTLNDLHVIQNGDHSFQIAKKNLELTGMTHEQAEERAAEAVAMFVSRIRAEKMITEPTGRMLGKPTIETKGDDSQTSTSSEKVVAKEVKTTVVGRIEERHECVEERQFIVQLERVQENQYVKECESIKEHQRINFGQIIQKMRKKSERIVKMKLSRPVYDKDGGGSSIDKPINLE